jgi:hypothetical protein
MGTYHHFPRSFIDNLGLKDPDEFDRCLDISTHFHDLQTNDFQDEADSQVFYGARLLYIAHILGFEITEHGMIKNAKGDKLNFDDLIRIIERRLGKKGG